MTASTDNGRRSGGGQSSPLGLEEVASLAAGERPAHLPDDEALPPASRAIIDDLLPTPAASLGTVNWGKYGPAITRAEHVTGREAPAPTNPGGRDGKHRLASRFVEWMMLLPDGHVTGRGLSRAQELARLGNGVVPLQAAASVAVLLERFAADKKGLSS